MSEYDHEPVRGLPGVLPSGEALLWQGAPEWRSLVLPDRSHVTREGRAALTQGLILALERRGWLDG